MKFVLPVFFLLAGCASTVAVSLPLHEDKITVPSSVARRYARSYIDGYEASWVAYLKVYARNIDHKREFLEDVATGDPNYISGWYASRDDFEALVRRLITKFGKEATKDKLVAALEKKEAQPAATAQRP